LDGDPSKTEAKQYAFALRRSTFHRQLNEVEFDPMAHYVISYDLHNARNYQPVWNMLEKWGAVRLLESLWVLTISTEAGTLRTALQGAADNDDSIAVIELKAGSEWSTVRGRPLGVEWLSRNIKRY
jgi:CRISPR/Cas system-associated endoribonuclease Cas2